MVDFTFSKDMEIKEIWWIFSEYDFFVKNNYKVYYPKVSSEITKRLAVNYKDAYARKKLRNEFEQIFETEIEIYERTLKSVRAEWQRIEKEFFELLSGIQLSHSKNITCYVSRYGPGGSYYAPDKISIRLVEECNSDITEANEKIAHEIMHLAIFKIVKKYDLNFENTERLVDLILTETAISKLLNNPTIQGFGDDRLDTCFKNNYPNIEKIIKEFIV